MKMAVCMITTGSMQQQWENKNQTMTINLLMGMVLNVYLKL